MRLSQLFGRTLREGPSEAELASQRLLARAGMIRSLAGGAYAYLPLGWRVLKKIEHIVREEMDALGGQEMRMPTAPLAGGREAVTGLVRGEIGSYRQLPLLIHWFRAKFRDQPPRRGLLGAHEFVAHEAYSLHANAEDLDEFYPRMCQAYAAVLRRCGLEATLAEGDAGHELAVLCQAGDENFILCSVCHYAAGAAWAAFAKGGMPREPEGALEKVATPGCKTIQAVADYLGVPTERTLKAVFYAHEEGIVFVVIRGDLEVSEAKLSNALGGAALHGATGEELARAGIVAGYASPVRLSGVTVVADDSILTGNNFVAGANEEGYHLVNVNYPRDFEADVVADIALARAGYTCLRCGGELEERRGIAVGQLSKLGTAPSEEAGATFLDRNGRARPVVVGSYGLDLGRLMAAVVEQNHDERGIVWPPSIAPFQIHLIALGRREEVVERAEGLYADLRAYGYEVLYDDRDESAGVKFNDADLIGVPLRLTVSRRTLEREGVEVKLRCEAEARLIGLEALHDGLKTLCEKLYFFGGLV